MVKPRRPFFVSLLIAAVGGSSSETVKAIWGSVVSDFWKDTATPFLSQHVGPWSAAMLETIGPFWGGVISAFALMFVVEMAMAWRRKPSAATPVQAKADKTAAPPSNKADTYDDPGIGLSLNYYLSGEWSVGVRFHAFFKDLTFWLIDETERKTGMGEIEKAKQIAKLTHLPVAAPNTQEFIEIIRAVRDKDGLGHFKVNKAGTKKEFLERIERTDLQRFMLVVTVDKKVIKSLAFVMLARKDESERPLLIDEGRMAFKYDWAELFDKDVFDLG